MQLDNIILNLGLLYGRLIQLKLTLLVIFLFFSFIFLFQVSSWRAWVEEERRYAVVW